MGFYKDYYSKIGKDLSEELAERIKDAANLLGHTIFYIHGREIKPFCVGGVGLSTESRIYVIQLGANPNLKHLDELFITKELAEIKIDEDRLADMLKDKELLENRITILSNTICTKKNEAEKCVLQTTNY